jgi:TPR repeat protein
MGGYYVDFTDQAAELQKKADAGDAEAQYTFAFYLLREPDLSRRKGLTPEEVKRGIHYLQMAAAQGYSGGLAALDIADYYFRGELAERDYKKARLWYNTALLKNNPPAACSLGDFAYHGYDCEVNFEEAARLYMRAAPGFINAVYRLGDMYLKGEYFVADPDFARKLYEYVLACDERFYKRYRFYSDAYDLVRQRIDEMERNAAKYKVGGGTESPEQAEMRKTLIKIIELENAADGDDEDDDD